jgi:hypothetical protein
LPIWKNSIICAKHASRKTVCNYKLFLSRTHSVRPFVVLWCVITVIWQSANRRPVIVEARVRYQASPCSIYGRQSGTGSDFVPNSSVLPCQYYSAIALYSHHWRHTTSAIDGDVKKKYFFLFCTDILYRQTAGPIRGTPAVSHCRIDCLFARHLHGKSRNFCVAISGICAEIRDRNLMNRKQKG